MDNLSYKYAIINVGTSTFKPANGSHSDPVALMNCEFLEPDGTTTLNELNANNRILVPFQIKIGTYHTGRMSSAFSSNYSDPFDDITNSSKTEVVDTLKHLTDAIQRRYGIELQPANVEAIITTGIKPSVMSEGLLEDAKMYNKQFYNV
jgi:hypothetical protein